MEFFDIAGNEFYFDLDNISDFVRINEKEPKNLEELLNTSEEDKENKENEELTEFQGPLIDMTRWDLVKVMIETILSENGIVDEGMGSTMLGSQLSIPCRLSFNTLIKHKLIKRN
jgi:hypothetical protein